MNHNDESCPHKAQLEQSKIRYENAIKENARIFKDFQNEALKSINYKEELEQANKVIDEIRRLHENIDVIELDSKTIDILNELKQSILDNQEIVERLKEELKELPSCRIHIHESFFRHNEWKCEECRKIKSEQIEYNAKQKFIKSILEKK